MSKIAELEQKLNQQVESLNLEPDKPQVTLITGDLPPVSEAEIPGEFISAPETKMISYDKQPEGRKRRLEARFQEATRLKGRKLKTHEKLLKLARKKAIVNLKTQTGRKLEAFQLQAISNQIGLKHER